MKRSSQITLVGVIVGAVALILLIWVAVATVTRALELSTTSKCARNLNSIGMGIHMYLAEHEAFPLLYEHGRVDVPVDTSTHSDDVWDADPLKTNAMQNVWLLIKNGTPEQAFECPNDGDYVPRSESGVSDLGLYGWVDKRNYSYGLHKPYDDEAQPAGPEQTNQAPLTDEVQGNFVIMTDKNHGSKGPGRLYWNSREDRNRPSNHVNDGLYCLTYQGSVKFHKARMGSTEANSNAGINGDDVYTVEGVTAIPVPASADPKTAYDTFIVPWK